MRILGGAVLAIIGMSVLAFAYNIAPRQFKNDSRYIKYLKNEDNGMIKLLDCNFNRPSECKNDLICGREVSESAIKAAMERRLKAEKKVRADAIKGEAAHDRDAAATWCRDNHDCLLTVFAETYGYVHGWNTVDRSQIDKAAALKDGATGPAFTFYNGTMGEATKSLCQAIDEEDPPAARQPGPAVKQ